MLQQRVPPVRVLRGHVGGAVLPVAAGGRGVVLAAAARRAAHLRRRALPDRQPRALLPEQLEGNLSNDPHTPNTECTCPLFLWKTCDSLLPIWPVRRYYVPCPPSHSVQSFYLPAIQIVEYHCLFIETVLSFSGDM